MLNKFFRSSYKKFIQESLDTEGKSKHYFLEMLEVVIDETRAFMALLKAQVFQENHLDFDAEVEGVLSSLFNDY